MNRYKLTDEVRKKYKIIIEKFIEELENKDLENSEKLLEKDFSDTQLNPYILDKLLRELGYELYDDDENGCEMDFWMYYSKEGFKDIMINGCGITFELKLSEVE